MNRTIVWFRRDLRISDHLPLYRAALRGAVIPVFVLDRALLHHPETAAARVQFMLESLQCLDQDLQSRGGRLIVRSGDPVAVLPELVRQTQAEGIYAYIDYERIYGRVRDARLNRALAEQQLKIRWFEPAAGVADLIAYPDYRQVWNSEIGAALTPTPARIQVPPEVASEPIPGLTDLGLVADAKPIPPAGTETARQMLGQFAERHVNRYYWELSYPGAEATTGISPHLKFGVISPRECVQIARQWELSPKAERSRQQLIARLRWGSGFAQRFRYLPQLELRSLYTVFDTAFDCALDSAPDSAIDSAVEESGSHHETLYQAWQNGQTGFPIVDAAARCLQATGGWKALNFRSRAIYASFLSNLMGLDWRLGALHFMRHLIDGDCPIDHYQWAMQAGVTHCIDKSWTRIYNPGQVAVDRCDPEGRFIKRWLPELADLPPHQLGSPPPMQGYPAPILDYRQARQRRVQQLEQQRQAIRAQNNLLPHLARLPASLLPFGSDRFGSNRFASNQSIGGQAASEIAWAIGLEASNLDLFPLPLDLDALDPGQAGLLRTWFVAHVEIQPHRFDPNRSGPSQRRQSSRCQRQDSPYIQLSLL